MTRPEQFDTYLQASFNHPTPWNPMEEGLTTLSKLSPDSKVILNIIDTHYDRKKVGILLSYQHILEMAKTPSEYLLYTEKFFRNDVSKTYDSYLRDALWKSFDHFFALNPTQAEINTLVDSVKSYGLKTFYFELEKMLSLARKPDDYIAVCRSIGKYDLSGGKGRHLVDLQNQQLSKFLKLNPSPQQIHALLDIAKENDWKWFTFLEDEFLKTAKNADEFAQYSSRFFDLGIPKKYHETLVKDINHPVYTFLKMNPDSQALALYLDGAANSPYRGIAAYSEEFLEHAKTPEEYVMVAEKMHQIDKGRDFTDEINKNLQSSFDHFKSLKPSVEQIEKFQLAMNKSKTCNLGLNGALKFLKAKLGVR